MKSRTFGLLAVAMMVLVLAIPVSALPAPDPTGLSTYIVLLEGDSLSSYRGGLPGLAATNPAARGETKLDAKSPASVAYLLYLAGRHAETIATMEQALGHGVDVIYRYDVVLNGLAVRLTAQEAKAVAGLPGVIGVQRETIEQPDTDVSVPWIGAPSIWDGSAVPGGIGTRGEGVIVGVLDTGINSDHASFADLGGDGYDHTNPWGSGNYVGYCVANPTFCNDKLIGAWSYTTEPGSPEDVTNGHGSHTSSTAAGNYTHAVKTTPSGYTVDTWISGVAPHANLIMYDVCDTSGCGTSDSVAATNQAVADGVDVINFSISGGNNPYYDSVEMAFLGATDAGVFVSTSAGNSGPGAGTVAHRSPWVSTVAATTHNRVYASSLVDMSGGITPPADMAGQAIATGHGPAPIVYAGDYGDALCLSPFPAGTWTNDEIVVCDRGTNARVDKGANVLAGGAGGFVLANDAASGNSLTADAHYLPAVHITYDDGLLLKAWLAEGTGHTATIPGTTEDLSPENGDIMASFSSRGPSTNLDVLKPDMAAPGVAVLAAYRNDIEFEWAGGTSMASPHNAGAGALLTALFPSWTPSQIKSAIMTTSSMANLRKEDGFTPADPFDVGAGRDDLTRAALAGFVLDETTANYQAANPVLGGDPRTLNLPNLSDAECAGTCYWSRTLQSTLGSTASWTATAVVPDGMTLTVAPSQFDLAGGATQSVVISAEVSDLPIDVWAFGTVIFTPSDPSIPTAHFAVAVVPVTGPPVISVSPDHLGNVMEPDKVETYPLEISNSGASMLEWAIAEDDGATRLGPELLDWADNFDSYGTDLSLHGLGGWKGWGNDPGATAYTRDTYAVSAPNSVEIAGASDLVHEYSGYSTGIWHYTAQQYIPDEFGGETYFILLNQYDDAGATLNWSAQVDFNGASDMVINDGPAGGTLPLIRGVWVEILVEIDLYNNVQRFYYGGDLLFEDSWTEGLSGGGILNIGAVDLFANGATEVYYDDLSLAEVLPGVCDVPSDIPWASVSPVSGTTDAGESSLVDVTFDSTGLSAGTTYNGTLCVLSNDPASPVVAVPLTLIVQQVWRIILPMVFGNY